MDTKALNDRSNILKIITKGFGREAEVATLLPVSIKKQPSSANSRQQLHYNMVMSLSACSSRLVL